MDISKWLHSNTATYSQGLQLLIEFGSPSTVLLAILQKGPTTYNRRRLLLELEKINSVPSPSQQSVKTKTTANTTRGARETYPPELHPAFDRQNQLYSTVNHLQPQLDLLYANDIGQCHQAVQEIIASWREIDKIYELLDYWTEHKVVLPNRYFVQDDQFQSTDLKEWIREKERLYKFIQRNKSNPDKAAEVASRRRQLAKVKSYIANA